MIRLSPARTAVVLAALAGACGGDRRDDVASRATRDTSSAPAAEADTVATPTDTVPRAVGRETTVTRPDTATPAPAPAPARPRARPSAERKPAPAPKPAKPAKPDTPAVRPNVDPARLPPGETPAPVRVPRPADQPPARDTAATAPSPSTQPLRDEYHRPPKDTVSQAVYDGWKQYNLNCARCHGEDVLGTTIAPHLIESVKPSGPINTKELFMQTVCQGRPEKGMPAWCPLGLDMAKIDQMYQYVKGRSDAKIGPGRPAVRAGS